MNQSVGPGYTGDILYFMRVLLFTAYLWMGYEVSRPRPAGDQNPGLLLPGVAGLSSQDQEWPGLPPWQRKASEKAVTRYTESQEKKWRRWNEAMFERSA
jgi:hypothetical protein